MRPQTVILADGTFPKRGGAARRLLEGAARVICCDGAADAYRRHLKREPFAVVGDCDSVKGRFANVVRIAEQETNDLEKAVRWCRVQGWDDPVVVGATGRREDHAIGNVFRALDLGVEIVTDEGRFVPIHGHVRLRVAKGAAISIFAPDPKTRMTSKGLKWPLDGVKFENLFCATLNRATRSQVELTTDRPVLVWVGFVSRGGAAALRGCRRKDASRGGAAAQRGCRRKDASRGGCLGS